jgi:excisionase family DNA binding protein
MTRLCYSSCLSPQIIIGVRSDPTATNSKILPIRQWKLVDSARPLPQDIVSNLRNVFRTEFTYNSNAIEGNSLTLRETQLVIEEGQTIRGKSLREVYEARNHPEAIEYVESLANEERRLTDHDILSLHQIIMKDAMDDARNIGRYRNGEVRISGLKYVPPPAYDAPGLMEELIETINDNLDEYTTVELSAIVLHRFVFIHPFYDGNGRIARLLTNLVLMKRRYVPIIIPKSDREKYLNYLVKADRGDYKSLVNFVAQYVLKHLGLVLRAIEQKPRSDMLTLDEASKLASVSSDYLRVLANKGLIPAVKDGRNWVISRADLIAYAKSHTKKTRRRNVSQR